MKNIAKCYFVICAPRHKLNKFRICGIHFPEDMLIPYTPKRCLKENPLPSLYLPVQVDIAQDDANTISTANIDNSENVE